MNSHYIWVVTKPCNMKLVIGITLISVNQNSSTTLVRSVIKYLGGLNRFVTIKTHNLNPIQHYNHKLIHPGPSLKNPSFFNFTFNITVSTQEASLPLLPKNWLV